MLFHTLQRNISSFVFLLLFGTFVLSAQQCLVLYLCCLQINMRMQHYMECKWQGIAWSIVSLLDCKLQNIQNLISHPNFTASKGTFTNCLTSKRDRNKMTEWLAEQRQQESHWHSVNTVEFGCPWSACVWSGTCHHQARGDASRSEAWQRVRPAKMNVKDWADIWVSVKGCPVSFCLAAIRLCSKLWSPGTSCSYSLLPAKHTIDCLLSFSVSHLYYNNSQTNMNIVS